MRQILVPLIAVVLAGLLWLATRGGDSENPVAVPPPGKTAPVSPESTAALPGARAAAEPATESARASAASERSTSAGADLDDPVQCILIGRVTAAGGAPLEGEDPAYLRLTGFSGEGGRTRTDDAGAYSLSGLAPGPWWVSVGARGYLTVEQRIELDLAEPVRRLDFALEEQPLVKVKVTAPDDSPIFAALQEAEPPIRAFELLPVATREHPGEWFYEVVGSLNNPFGIGHYWQSGFGSERLPDEYVGTLLLDEGPPAWISMVLFHRVLASERIEAGADEVAFVLDPEDVRDAFATLRLRVLDAESDEPLPDAKVDLTGGSMSFGPRGERGDDGVIVLANELPGRRELVVRAPEHELYRAEVQLESGAVTDLGTIALERAVTIRGTVTDEAGSPLAVSVTSKRLDRPPSARWGQYSTDVKSAADGSFELGSLGRGEYLLSVGGRGESLRSPGVLVDTRAGAVEGVRLVAGPAATLVLVPPDSGWRGLSYELHDDSGRRIYRSRFWGAAPRSIELPHGPASFTMTDADGATVAEHALLLGDEPLVLEL